MELTDSRTTSLALGISLLLVVGVPAQTLAQQTSPAETWYLGEGAEEGMSLMYKIEHGEINSGTAYNMTITLEEVNRDGNWLANLVVSNNQEVLTQDVVLNPDLSPLQSADVPESFQPYLGAYGSIFLWLADWGVKEHPLPLRLNSWGSLACAGCFDRSTQPRAVENATLSAGTFEATVVTRCKGCDTKTWILDGFPYPVKEEVRIAWNGDTKKVPYKYELLHVSDVSVIRNEMLDGTVSDRGCIAIGGSVTNRTMGSGERVPICEYRDILLSTFNPFPDGGGCLAAEGFWADPETGESFSVPSVSCDVPQIQSDAFCNDARYFKQDQGDSIAHYHKIIKVGDMHYTVLLDTSGVGCYGLNLRQETKEFFIVLLSDDAPTTQWMSVTFPAQMLRGNYTVVVDDNPTNFSMMRGSSTVTLSNIELPPASDNGINVSRVQVIGTEVIPEFASSLMILALVTATVSVISLVYRGKKAPTA